VSDGNLEIDFERSGGFAGIPLRVSVNAQELGQTEADELRRLVEHADVPSLERIAREPRRAQPDRFQYDLSVTIGDSQHRVSLGESDVTENAKPLFQRLTELARQR
jgi:hypothetical protein